MDNEKTVTVSAAAYDILREVGCTVADVRPDLNDRLSDRVIVSAGIIALSMLFRMVDDPGWTMATVITTAFTVALEEEQQ